LGELVDLVFSVAEQGWAIMELKLVVLAGAKEGTQIPLKKDKFLIGRSTECTLRAGSSAISRRHSAIVRTEDGKWMVRDLGSRNGTFLNDQKVETSTALSVGDELRIGPLHFRVEEYVKAAGDAKPESGPKLARTPSSQAPSAAASPGTVEAPHDINRAKKPPAKDVAEVVQRTASKSAGDMSEDDISRWLLGIEAGSGDDKMLKETQTLSMEETTTINRGTPIRVNGAAPAAGEAQESADDADASGVEPAVESTSEEKSGGWSLFKLGKGKAAKKQPGKLPPRPSEQTKDSREAAADILREMTRRR
jgi:pSer/pThr/pTyr-binding forkhead associated (FHA) protein